MNAQTATVAKPPMTLEEFLSWDGDGHAGKQELVEGVVRAMAPASAMHSMIQLNIGTSINNHLRSSRSSCRAGTKAPIVPPLGKRINARAPDVSVTCCRPSPEGTFIDPVLNVEVMSPTNEADTWESIHALAGLQSFQEVLVAYSTRVEIQLFHRDAQGAWLRDPQTSTSLSDTLQLRSIGLELPVSDIYFGTHLEK